MGVFLRRRGVTRQMFGAAALSVALLGALVSAAPAKAAVSGDWTTYLGDNTRSGFNGAETAITGATASNLRLKWSTASAGNVLFSQPIATNGLVYWGSFDGYERATNGSGALVWQTFLGQTSPGPACNPPSAGVASTATVSKVSIGASTSVLYVGGGDGQFYALDALSGSVLWNTRLGPSPSNFIWSSPAVYKGSVYIGLASFGDCPLVQGQLIQLSSTTGAVQHVFDAVPNGCTGGGVWASPTIDAGTGTVYFATGNPGSCPTAEVRAESVVEVRASDLSLIGSWSVPIAERGGDSDFGATSTLFTFKNAHKLHRMVGVVNKNGTYYAFARDQLGRGPTWRAKVSNGGDAPQNGTADISPSAWDGSTLYVAGGTATVNGVTCPGIVSAVQPSSGRFKWQQCMPDGPVLGAVTAVRGVVTVGEGNRILVLDAPTGHGLFSYVTAADVWGAGAISNGMLYQGDIGGTLYALGL